MNTVVQSDLLWSIQPVTGWTVEQHTDAMHLKAPTGDASVRLGTFPTDKTSAQDWLEAAAYFNRCRGRSVTPVECGQFSGYLTEFAADGRYHRGWTLRSGDFPLDASYSCTDAARGRDDEALDAMLQTLLRHERTA